MLHITVELTRPPVSYTFTTRRLYITNFNLITITYDIPAPLYFSENRDIRKIVVLEENHEVRTPNHAF